MALTDAQTTTRIDLRARQLAWVPAAAVLLAVGWGAQQFTPMLLVYRHALDLSTGTLEAMFGFYALGLIPGLLLAGPLSDARGRRPIVIAGAALSLLSSIIVAAAGHAVTLLLAGRVLAGVSSGVVFGVGSAWLRELSEPGRSEHAVARRTVVAMTAGFAAGPLVSGLLAQWAPAPRVVPFLPQIALITAVLALLGGTPETVRARKPFSLELPPGVRTASFVRLVAPMAPWVFAAPAIAFALLPSVVGAERATDGIAVTATITMLTALSGVLIQPLARRLDGRAAGIGMVVLAAGLALSALAVDEKQVWMLVPTGLILGSAYGMTLVAGLVEIHRLADPSALGGLTAAFYALTYLGFAAPYLLALGAHVASYAILLLITAALALATAAAVARN
jgi:predicted MFS family arabinose efflux permease